MPSRVAPTRYCCEHCFANPWIADRIRKTGTTGDCSYCGSTGAAVVEPRNVPIEPLLQYYSPSDDGGGRELLQTLDRDWLLFGKRMPVDRRARLLDAMLAGTTLSSTHRSDTLCDREGSATAAGIWFEFLKKIENEMRFGAGARKAGRTVARYLSWVFKRTATKVPKGTRIYRARIGSEKEQYSDCAPIRPWNMGMPPRGPSLGGGRANPPGIPVFYGADAEATAVAEVRPGLTDVITVAQFKVIKAARIVDLSHDYFPNPFATDLEQEIVTRHMVLYLDLAFSSPVSPAESPVAYLGSQFVAERIFGARFAGFRYSSSLREQAHNIVLKNEDSLLVLHSKLVRPTRLTVRYRTVSRLVHREEEFQEPSEDTDDDIPF